jgi:hypothetical protein
MDYSIPHSLRKEETANAVSPLMGSAIDALPCAARPRCAGAVLLTLDGPLNKIAEKEGIKTLETAKTN